METRPRSNRRPSTPAAPRPVGTSARKRVKAVASDPPVPTHEQIALRAHELYVRSGCQPGREQEFWFEAERQLRSEARTLSV